MSKIYFIDLKISYKKMKKVSDTGVKVIPLCDT